jgi:hypothetical protein
VLLATIVTVNGGSSTQPLEPRLPKLGTIRSVEFLLAVVPDPRRLGLVILHLPSFALLLLIFFLQVNRCTTDTHIGFLASLCPFPAAMATDNFDLGALNFSSKDTYSVRNSRPGISSRNSRASSIRSSGTGGQDRHDVVCHPQLAKISRWLPC